MKGEKKSKSAQPEVQEDLEMTAEVQVVFRTNLPEEFIVPDVQISLTASSTKKDLT